MLQIYDSLKRLISPGMVPTTAKIVDEKESDVSTAISTIFASLLGVMLKNGNSPQMRNILETAGNLNVLSTVGNICKEQPTAEQRKTGDDFLQLLLGDKAAAFTAPIARQAGISGVATNRLISMLAPVFAGYFGTKLVKDGWSLHKVLHEIKDQKRSFEESIPGELVKTFDLSAVLDTTTTTYGNEPEKQRSSSWITWLIVILVVLLIIFLWRSCRHSSADKYSQVTAVIVDPAVPDPAGVATTEITLPDGVKISVYEDGAEQAMVKYLDSDAFKNATDKDLQTKWFEFDNVKFEFGSGTKLMAGSQKQIDNIIAILKNHKDAKVRIIGFADRKGTEEANMEVSKERARTIEKMFERAGVGSQIAKAEGLGDEYAEYSASAADSLRAKDRDIALRFVK